MGPSGPMGPIRAPVKTEEQKRQGERLEHSHRIHGTGIFTYMDGSFLW